MAGRGPGVSSATEQRRSRTPVALPGLDDGRQARGAVLLLLLRRAMRSAASRQRDGYIGCEARTPLALVPSLE
jgi:hypothetical protein